MLQFEDTNHFEGYLNYLSQNHVNLDEWEASQGFHSTRRAFYSDTANIELEHPLKNDLLATVLNEDNMLVIQPWIFKLNASNEKVYALHTDNIEKLAVLRSSETPTDHDIIAFDFEDDVLDLLSTEPSPPGAKGKCAESARGQHSVEYWNPKYTTENFATGIKKQEVFKATYRYDGLGLVKTLYINFKHAERTATLKSLNGGNPIWNTFCYKTVKVDHDYTFTGSFTENNGNIQSVAYTSLSNGTNLIGSEVKKSDYETEIWRTPRCFRAVDMTAKVYFESSMLPDSIMSFDLGELITN
jgi:hypothetical protein